MLKKGLFALVLLAFLGTAKCQNADLAAALGGVPIVGAMIQPPATTPAYLKAVGTPAPSALPESDLTTWFPAEAPTDPYNAKLWGDINLFTTIAQTQLGWTEACKKVDTVAGTDRAASPKLGALACSSDPTVTQFQQFAVQLLGTQANLALWMKGELSGSTSAIHARQAELRVFCTTSVVARQGLPETPWSQACSKAMDASYLSGDGPASFTALGDAYALVATEIAKLDPEIDPEPGYFGSPAAAASPTKTP
ncbi:MAG: hypothetical protein ABI577_17445 [bacterium]